MAEGAPVSRNRFQAQQVALLAFFACAIAAQSPQDQAKAARTEAFAELEQQLSKSPRPSLTQRQKLLLDFLEAHADRTSTTPSLEELTARLRLAEIALVRLDAQTAQKGFAAIADAARDRFPILRQRAQFGLHQAFRLAGEHDSAKATLETLRTENKGTEVERDADLALAQLDARRPLAVGETADSLLFGKDLDGETVTAESFEDEPRLFVFWSTDHAPSVRRLEALARAWRKLGLPMRNLIAYCAEEDVDMLRTMAHDRGYTFRILPASGTGYLHADWLQLGVTAVPSCTLFDAEQQLIAIDPPPHRIAACMQR
jgi:hypothetical protein